MNDATPGPSGPASGRARPSGRGPESDAAEFLIGVDAGGSHTTAMVADVRGVVLGQAHGEAGAARPGHEQQAANAIADTTRRVMRHLKPGARAAMLVVGAAGTGEDTPREALRAALEVAGLAGRVHVTTDADIALESAFGGQPGIVLLAGTGSIALARLPGGEIARVGGLGPTLGDQGSGFDLGRQGLRAAALAFERLGPATRLQQQLVPDDIALSNAVLTQHELEPRLVAMLARLVIEAADGGDVVAQQIAERGAGLLAAHVEALATRFPTGAPVHVALGGGLLSSIESYRQRVVTKLERLGARIALRQEPIEPAAGAISIARKMLGDR